MMMDLMHDYDFDERGGPSVVVLDVKPGFVVKTKTSTKGEERRKVLVNACGAREVPKHHHPSSPDFFAMMMTTTTTEGDDDQCSLSLPHPVLIVTVSFPRSYWCPLPPLLCVLLWA